MDTSPLKKGKIPFDLLLSRNLRMALEDKGTMPELKAKMGLNRAVDL